MEILFNDKKFNVTEMIVTTVNSKDVMRYNVFDENYKFVTSISCNNKNEFIQLFNNYLKQKYEME